MIHPHTKFKTVQDFILYKVNLEESDLPDYDRPLQLLPTKKRPSLVSLLWKVLETGKSILP